MVVGQTRPPPEQSPAGISGMECKSSQRLHMGHTRHRKGVELGNPEVGGGRTLIEDECGDGDDGASRRRLNSLLALAAVDWEYDDHNIIFRGAYQYGYVGNSNPTTYEDVLYGSPPT